MFFGHQEQDTATRTALLVGKDLGLKKDWRQKNYQKFDFPTPCMCILQWQILSCSQNEGTSQTYRNIFAKQFIGDPACVCVWVLFILGSRKTKGSGST